MSPAPNSSSVTISSLSRQRAQDVLDASGRGSWRQYPAYSQIAAQRIGASDEYVAFERGGEQIALANIRTKKLRIIGAGIAQIGHGPVLLGDVEHWEANLADVLTAARAELVEKRGMALRIEPDVGWHAADFDFSALARRAGFSDRTEGAFQTFLIDLTPDLEQLRKGLAGKWRTDLNRGERQGLEVTRSDKPEDVLRLSALLEKLADQKGFSIPQGPDFFARVAELAIDDEKVVIHLVWKDDELLSGHIGGYSGDMAVYLLGATSNKGRELRASYVAQWAVIEYARELGLAGYDLGGVDRLENPSVYRFKERMGGAYYDGPKPVICYPGALSGLLLRMTETAYRKMKGLRK